MTHPAVIVAAFLALTTHGAAQTVPLVGGSVVIGPSIPVVAYDDHVNFPMVAGWDGGVIWAHHILGKAGTPQTNHRLISTDGGQTWQEPGFFFHTSFGPTNSLQLDDGRIYSVVGGVRESQTTHPVRFFVYPDATSTYAETRSEMTFPFLTSMVMYSSLVRMPDGRLIQSAYGQRDGQLSYTAFTIQSADQGKTWSYLSTIATPQTNVFDSGPNETSLTLLADGTLLALVRQGHGVLEPLLQSKSTDGGQRWSTPITVATGGGLDPQVIRLTNNTLVASYGRRGHAGDWGVFVMFDFTGTGDHWQTLHVYDGYGSAYNSLVEIEPNKVMLFYDHSGYGSRELAAGDGPNRLVYQVIDVVPEPVSAGVLLAGTVVLLLSREAGVKGGRA